MCGERIEQDGTPMVAMTRERSVSRKHEWAQRPSCLSAGRSRLTSGSREGVGQSIAVFGSFGRAVP